jgi:hypothetical protein
VTEDTAPYVSTGTIEQQFVNSLNLNPDLKAEGILTFSYLWKNKTLTVTLGPGDLASYGDDIEAGRLRYQSAIYLTLRDGNRCVIANPSFCIMGIQPFEHPEKADFDHIDGNRRNHKLKNLRLSCHPCNSHQQKFQWKRDVGATSTLETKTESHPSSAETERSLAMRPRWLSWLRGTLDGKDAPIKKGDSISASELARRAPRAIARTELGEESLGVKQTFMSYIEIDSTEGGPLTLSTKVNKQTGRTEIWVKMSE